MQQKERTRIFLVTPDRSVAGPLRDVFRTGDKFCLSRTCFGFEQLEEALATSFEEFDLLVVSSRFDPVEAEAIHDYLLDHYLTGDIPIVLLADSTISQVSKIAQLLNGYHGVLTQPFSVQDIDKVLGGAFEAKRDESRLREAKLVRLLARAVMDTQAEISDQLASKAPSRIARAVLRELISEVRGLPTHFHSAYLDMVTHEYLVRIESRVFFSKRDFTPVREQRVA